MARFTHIIPLGDHCAISLSLDQLGWRKASYPFDWNVCTDQLNGTNLYRHGQLLTELLAGTSSAAIVTAYTGDMLNEPDKNKRIFNQIWCPHDEDVATNRAKYERRFERLREHITDKSCNLYILLTRRHRLEPTFLFQLRDQLRSYHSESHLLIISGIAHEYLEEAIPGITYKYIYYDPEQFWAYDYSAWRPQLSAYLSEFLKAN